MEILNPQRPLSKGDLSAWGNGRRGSCKLTAATIHSTTAAIAKPFLAPGTTHPRAQVSYPLNKGTGSKEPGNPRAPEDRGVPEDRGAPAVTFDSLTSSVGQTLPF